MNQSSEESQLNMHVQMSLVSEVRNSENGHSHHETVSVRVPTTNKQHVKLGGFTFKGTNNQGITAPRPQVQQMSQCEYNSRVSSSLRGPLGGKQRTNALSSFSSLPPSFVDVAYWPSTPRNKRSLQPVGIIMQASGLAQQRGWKRQGEI